MMAGESTNATAGPLSRLMTVDAIAKVVAIGIVPAVVGGLHRVLAFAFSGHVPLSVAVDLPVPKLALLGVELVFPGALIALLVAVYFRAAPLGPLKVPPWVRSMRFRIRIPFSSHLKRVLANRWVALAVSVIISISVTSLLFFGIAPAAWSALTSSNGPGSLLTTVVELIVIPWGFWVGRGPTTLPFRRFLPVIGIITVAVAVVSTVGPTTAGSLVADVRFAGNAGLPDGTFSVLGETPPDTWLLACGDPSALVTRVPTTSIKLLVIRPFGVAPVVPTVAESLRTGTWVAGFAQECP